MNENTLPLRDIHLPPAVSWWPPAPGWWLLLGLLLAAVVGVWLWWRHRARRRLLRAAQAELIAIETGFSEHGDRLQLVQSTSTLLRRVALSRYPREQVASLTGEQWLRWLDTGLADEPFGRGPGRCLAEAPYARSCDADVDALMQICRRWLQAEFKRRGGDSR